MDNNSEINNKRNDLIRYAMYYGILLGLFWVFKYFFKIGSGFSDRVFIYIFYLLNVGTFLLVYIFTFKFKLSDPEKPRGTLACILFAVLTCFFASFFESLIVYIHYQFIDPDFFAKIASPVLNMINEFPNSPAAKETMISLFSNKPIYIFSVFLGNTFLGLLLGIFISFTIKTK